ncbi:hypothetical protein [Sutterella wadsworthensis]|uniref:hypothetical protein n=1 Tax=Sutterella wadsworthensis TaxID=40545 RepID=UPI0032BFE256
MVDVNKILGVPSENTVEKVKNNVKVKKSTEQTLLDLNKSLKLFIEVIDVAIKRKIDFKQINIENNLGISIQYNKDEFSKKVKKFQLKSAMKYLNDIVANSNFENLFEFVETSFKNQDLTYNRLLYYNNTKYIGFDCSNNTIFINFDGNKVEFLLFNLMDKDTEIEISLKTKEKINNTNESVNNDMELNTNELQEVEEDKISDENYVDILDSADDLINKFRK